MEMELGNEKDTQRLNTKIKRTNTKFFVQNVDSHVKMFGAFTLFTTLVVVAMSVYVVHYKEFRTSGSVLIGEGGNPLATADAELQVKLDHDSLTDGVLAHLKRINVRTSNGDFVGWDVIAFEKRVEDGIIVLHGPDQRMLTIPDGSPESIAAAEKIGAPPSDTNVTSGYVNNRRRLHLSHRGRYLESASEGFGSAPAGANAPGSATPGSLQAPVMPPMEDPNDHFKGFTNGCTLDEVQYEGTRAKPTTKTCNCLKKDYWSNPNGCGKRPTNKQYGAAYLNKWAFLGDNCENKPCFNFDGDRDIAANEDYRGSAKFQADYPGNPYTGRTGPNGYYGLWAAPGKMEALSCVGRVTQKRKWWQRKCAYF